MLGVVVAGCVCGICRLWGRVGSWWDPPPYTLSRMHRPHRQWQQQQQAGCAIFPNHISTSVSEGCRDEVYLWEDCLVKEHPVISPPTVHASQEQVNAQHRERSSIILIWQMFKYQFQMPKRIWFWKLKDTFWGNVKAGCLSSQLLFFHTSIIQFNLRIYTTPLPETICPECTVSLLGSENDWENLFKLTSLFQKFFF